MAGWLPLFATSGGAFNGGRTTANFGDLIFSSEWPFLNLLKQQDRLQVYGGAGGPVEPSSLDDNGYPTSVTDLGAVARVYVPTQQTRPGRYVLRWAGNGSVVITGFTFTYHTGYSSADLTSSSGSGRVEFLPTNNDTFFTIGIGTIGIPYITNMQLYHIDDEAAVNSGQIFGTKFLARIREAKIGRLRFLSWPDYNKTNMTTWRTRMPVNQISYGNFRTVAAGYCNPASNSLSGKTYSFAAPSQDISTGSTFALADKACIHVKFTNACPVSTLTGSTTNLSDTIALTSHGLSVNDQCWTNQSDFGSSYIPVFVTNVPNANSIKLSLTLGGTAIAATSTAAIEVSPALLVNVGSTGAKVMRSSYGQATSTGGNSYPETGSNRIATLMYDAKLDAWLKQGGDTGDGSMGILAGVPIEHMISLCVAVGAHPHFVMPRYAMDPMTDWVTSLATYCRDNCPSWMKPAFEGPNECWNTFGGFYNATYAGTKAAYNWPGGGFDYHNWYGKVLSTMGQDIYTVYSSNTARFDLLCGVQTGLADVIGGTVGSDNRLDSAAYVAQAAAAQSGYIKAAAKNYVTTVAVANYFTPSDYAQSAETTSSASFAACEFVGAISGTALTVSSITFGSLAVGKKIFGGDGIPTGGATILSGSAPNWVLDTSLIVASGRMIAGNFSGSVVTNYVNTVNSGTGSFTIPKVLTLHTNWKTWAASKGVNKLACYEGGYSPDMSSSVDTTTALDQFRAAGKQEAVLQTYTTTNFNNFVGLTGSGFVAEYPATYFGGTSPSHNIWPIIDDIWTTKYMAAFEAVKAFNA